MVLTDLNEACLDHITKRQMFLREETSLHPQHPMRRLSVRRPHTTRLARKRENHGRDRAGAMPGLRGQNREKRPVRGPRQSAESRRAIHDDTIQGLKENIGGEAYVAAIVPVVDVGGGCRALQRSSEKEFSAVVARKRVGELGAWVGRSVRSYLGLSTRKLFVAPHLSFLHSHTAKLHTATLHHTTACQKFRISGDCPLRNYNRKFPGQVSGSPVKMPPKKVARPAQENISLGPQVREGELVFGGTFFLIRMVRLGARHR